MTKHHTIRDVIEKLKEHRETHRIWAKENTPDEPKRTYSEGTPAFHRHTIEDYDWMIECLEGLVRAVG